MLIDISSLIIWRPPSLSELPSYQIAVGLTYLGSKASILLLIYVNMHNQEQIVGNVNKQLKKLVYVQ